jgi:hypothetical protein
MDPVSVKEVVSQYSGHGWKLRRILVSQPDRCQVLGPFAAEESAEISNSDIDALWFSRRSKPGSETWELRRITGSPFALLAVIEDTATDGERERTLREIEVQMAKTQIQFSGH